jgi:hypothetical protein
MKPQNKLKNKDNAIQVAYFWNKKDPKKIDMIMTKTQKLVPEETFVKSVKAMIRKAKKLEKYQGIGYWMVDLEEVLKIMGDDNGNQGQKNLQRKSQPKGLSGSRVPKKGRKPNNKG